VCLAKTWSVVDALVHWAQPRARDLVAVRRAERKLRTLGAKRLTSEAAASTLASSLRPATYCCACGIRRRAGTANGAAFATTSCIASTTRAISRELGSRLSTRFMSAGDQMARKSCTGGRQFPVGFLPSPRERRASGSTSTRVRCHLQTSLRKEQRVGAASTGLLPTGRDGYRPQSPCQRYASQVAR
jgi:hypothetical protein